jgi:HK97 family phage prohead protease
MAYGLLAERPRHAETRQAGGLGPGRRGYETLPFIIGYASVFNSISHPIKGPDGRTFLEAIRPGAFRAVLRSLPDVPARIQHDPARELGRVSRGTLRVWEDSRGLAFALEPPQNAFGIATVDRVRSRDLWGASFLFVPGVHTTRNGIREVHTVSRLEDVTLTSNPYYGGTNIGLVPRGTPRDQIERYLRLLWAEGSL